MPCRATQGLPHALRRAVLVLRRAVAAVDLTPGLCHTTAIMLTRVGVKQLQRVLGRDGGRALPENDFLARW